MVRTTLQEAVPQMNDWVDVLGRAIEATRNGVLVTDPRLPDNPIVYANPAFERITGYTAEEVVGRNCRFLQGPDRGQPALEEVRAAIREERDCLVVVRNYRKDGTLFWQELSISPVRDESGRVTHFVGIQDDVTERKLAEARLAHEALHDPLTGLPNRALFADRLRETFFHAPQDGERAAAVLFLELENFGAVNESFGRDVGDRLLESVAIRLERCLREEATVARAGGAAFVVLIEGIAGAEDAGRAAERILEGLRRPFASEEGEIFVGASIGIALVSTAPGITHPRNLIRSAELAMYRSRSQGKGHYAVFEPGAETSAPSGGSDVG
jgi:diguanylate cyclase (GGDEF)-like protein/PAS domain S-box-containing protein